MIKAKPTRIFIVDDHPLVREALIDIFSDNASFEIIGQGGSADDAVAIVGAHLPDAILLDIRMGSGSGLDVLLALRLADWTQPVVMMTGYADPRTHERAAEYGAAVILDKPFDGEDLVRILQIVIATHPRGLDDDDDEPPTLRSPGRDPWPAARMG